MNEVPEKLNQHLTFTVDEENFAVFAVFDIDETIKSIR